MQASLLQRVTQHLLTIYRYDGTDSALHDSYIEPEESLLAIANELMTIMQLSEKAGENRPPVTNSWDENDIVMISYADSVISNDDERLAPLDLLKQFLDKRLSNVINTVHLLPFYPYTSDDGFAVSDYNNVRDGLGGWEGIHALSDDYKVMADLVINHCSASHSWVKDFIADRTPGKDYIYTATPDYDTSKVVRPRTNKLLQAVETASGSREVWCTFSEDQIDLNFENPRLLVEVVKIIKLYLDQGIRIFRLDAIAFIWKKSGTTSLNLSQTHEIVRLLRTLIEAYDQTAVIITETNIPNRENLSYFGNLNEAHWIYNFSLPPLLLNTLVSGNSHYLKLWMMSMPPAQNGTAYFNFIASHDGIGLRPTEGLLSTSEIDTLITTMENFGGKVSYRALENGESKPYEINISLFDALQGTHEGTDQYGFERFICAHTIMMALEGVPAFYIHSLLGTRNDYKRMELTGANRSINRHQWEVDELDNALDDQDSSHYSVFTRLTNLLGIRKQQLAFHPNATQFTLHLDDSLFGFWRQSIDRSQSIFCISNVSHETQELPLSSINLISTDHWYDLISCEAYNDSTSVITLAPYQTVWISNKLSSKG